MRYFTDNPLERLMMQVPKPMREETPPAPAKGKQVKEARGKNASVKKKEEKSCAL